MSHSPQYTSRAAQEPPGVLLEEASSVCMPGAPAAVSDRENHASAAPDDDTSQANTEYRPADKQAVVAHTDLIRSAPLLEDAVLACMPGAFQVPGPTDPISADIEREDQQQSPQPGIVSAYRVAEEEPAIVATPFKYIKFRFLIYGFVVTAAVALIVGLSVGLTSGGEKEQPSNPNPADRLVSSVRVTAEQEGTFLTSFIEAIRYIRTENGREIVTTTGSGVLNYCAVLPCNEGGCSLLPFGKVYEPGCCLGDDCSQIDKCGFFCPRRICHPSFDGCTEASCFECERGPNGEELYRFGDASFNMNCLRTGVAIGFNDKDDNVEHIYKWAIVCGLNVRGGYKWLNIGPGEYGCVAIRSGEGITKTVSLPIPCQFIQLLECGCAPDDMYTFGFPLPDGPCKTKQDCPYLCGDAGEEEAKMLCEVFPGIEWWEGDNPLYLSTFQEPKDFTEGNVTIQIDIFTE